MSEMPKETLVLKISSSLQEVAQLVDRPYNPPALINEQTRQCFEKEFADAHAAVRRRLEIFGDVDAFGEADFTMGPPSNSHRSIGIGVYSKQMFRPELIYLLKDTLRDLPEDYLIYIDGEIEPGMGTFYICLRGSTNEVVSYSPKREWLLPFGFK